MLLIHSQGACAVIVVIFTFEIFDSNESLNEKLFNSPLDN